MRQEIIDNLDLVESNYRESDMVEDTDVFQIKDTNIKVAEYRNREGDARGVIFWVEPMRSDKWVSISDHRLIGYFVSGGSREEFMTDLKEQL